MSYDLESSISLDPEIQEAWFLNLHWDQTRFLLHRYYDPSFDMWAVRLVAIHTTAEGWTRARSGEGYILNNFSTQITEYQAQAILWSTQ